MLPSAQFLFLRFAIGMNSLCEMRIIHFHPTLLPDHCFVLTVMIWAGPSLQLEIREICYRITVTRSSARDGAADTTESGEIPCLVFTTWHWRHSRHHPDCQPLLWLCMSSNACHLNPIMFIHCLSSRLRTKFHQLSWFRSAFKDPFSAKVFVQMNQFIWLYHRHNLNANAQGFLIHNPWLPLDLLSTGSQTVNGASKSI